MSLRTKKKLKKEILILEDKCSSLAPCNELHDNRIKKFEVENYTIRNQVYTLKLALAKFTIGSNTLMIVGSQYITFSKNGLGHKISL